MPFTAFESMLLLSPSNCGMTLMLLARQRQQEGVVQGLLAAGAAGPKDPLPKPLQQSRQK
jgi:hypothetical protein